MKRSIGQITSSYRIQFHAGFTFRDAINAIDYLHMLGVSHVYASPLLASRKGSTHGYDTVDCSCLNPEIGTDQEYLALANELSRRGMGIILDIVPNHMSVGADDNEWWNSVLKYGESSQYISYFDIYPNSSEPHFPLRVFLPVLGEPLDLVLKNSQLQLAFDRDGIFLLYFGRRFPLCLESEHYILRQIIADILSIKEIARGEYPELFAMVDGFDRFVRSGDFITGTTHLIVGMLLNDPFLKVSSEKTIARLNSSADEISELLSMQHYGLGYWAEDSERGNYRRFFDVSDLVGMKTERMEVFDDTHRRILELSQTSCIDGLRIDHPDGLFDPKGYFKTLRQKTSTPNIQERIAPYIFAEKILTAEEELPEDWPVDGTTGYDALNIISSIFVLAKAERDFDRIWESKVNSKASFSEYAESAKSQVLSELFKAEFNRLVDGCCELDELSAFHRDGIEVALRALLVNFPVYRTYIRNNQFSNAEYTYLERAREVAIALNVERTQEVLFVFGLLSGNSKEGTTINTKRLLFVGKFQQLTAPLMAKGVEDTAYYRYGRMISLNEVGGDPERFGISTDTAHSYFVKRQSRWPCSMSVLSTHDTKRGEDSRFRISTLSECAGMWENAVIRWEKLNAKHRSQVEDSIVPDRGTEYFLYQSFLGAWPIDASTKQFEVFTQRSLEFCRKAIREAKIHTSWRKPHSEYERAVEYFVKKCLRPRSEFVEAVNSFVKEIDDAARVHSISALLIKLTAPGIPDTFQGTEGWNYDYVDPDNRRSIDFDALEKQLTAQINSPQKFFESKSIPDHTKQVFMALILKARKENADLYERGHYVPLGVEGGNSDHVFAFARVYRQKTAIVVTPRLWQSLKTKGDPYSNQFWRETTIRLPEELGTINNFTNILTQESVALHHGHLLGHHAFQSSPFAVLQSTECLTST